MIAEIDLPAVISRWIHLFSVITVVGGTIFLRVVLYPSVKETLSDESHDSLRGALMRRWARVVHAAILLIILSGSYNFLKVLPTLSEPLPYHPIFGAKLLLALILFFIAIALTGRSAAFAGLRRRAPQWMAISILLAAFIVLLSNLLKNTSSSLGG